jgi:hypothetical protein
MARYERFTFLCDENERRAIESLASSLQRSQSDAVRLVVIAAAQRLVVPVVAQPPQMNKCALEKVQDDNA